MHIHDSTGVNIICDRAVCEMSQAYYTIDVASTISCTKAQLNSGWSVIGGHIIDTMGTAIVVVWDSVFNADSVQVMFNNSVCQQLCTAASIIKIRVVKNDLPIIGDSAMCSHTKAHYEIQPFVGGTKYTWSSSNNATISTTSQPNEIDITANADSGVVQLQCVYYNSLTDCGGRATFDVNITPKTFITTNANNICKGDSVQLIATGNTNNSWQWEITQPNTTKIYQAATDTLTYTPTAAGDYEISIVGVGLCGSNTIALKVFDTPAKPDTLRGADTVCTNETYSYSIAHPQVGVNYQWFIKSNTLTSAVITSATTGTGVTIKYTYNPANFYATIKVVGTNENGCVGDTATLNINKLKVKRGFVNADTVVCPDSKNTYETVEKTGDSYEWSVSPTSAGSIASSNGKGIATVLWNHAYSGGYVDVVATIKKCGTTQKVIQTVYLQAAPQLSLVFDTSVCRGTALNVQLQSNIATTIDNVLWSFGNGDTINNTTATMHYVYAKAILQNTNYTINATVKNIHFNGCIDTVGILVKQDYNNSNIIVKPSPLVDLIRSHIGDKVGICPPQLANIPLTGTLNPAYGNTDILTWVTPQGNTSCNTPFLCKNMAATGIGVYYLIATNAVSGCSSRSDNEFTVIKRCGDTIHPKVCIDTLANDTVYITEVATTNCWSKRLIGKSKYPIFSPSWSATGNYDILTTARLDTLDIVFNHYGTYSIGFGVSYDSTNKYCSRWSKEDTIVVPILPKLEYEIKCNSYNNGYVVTAGDYSGHLDSTTVTYSFYVDNVLKYSSSNYEYKDSSFALGTTHTVYIVVNYTYKGVSGSCTTAVKSFAIPTIPNANYTITNSAKHCEGLTLLFTPDSAFSSNNSYWWDFKDGAKNINYAPEKVFTFDPNNTTTPQPSLQVSNGLGCVVTSSQNWVVKPNLLSGQLDKKGDNFICPNSYLSIQFTATAGSPTNYVWFNSRNPLSLLYTPVYTGYPYPANSTGSYWVRLEDNDGCYKNIEGNAVVIVASVTVPKITSSLAPATGNDTLNICANAAHSFTLSTAAGLQQYIWLQDGNNLNIDANSITIAPDSLPIGLHSYTVRTTVNLGYIICDTISQTFYVRINAAPAKPVIHIGTVNCSSYNIELVATSNAIGTFVWSNGDYDINKTSSSTTVGQGGIYGVELNTGLACTSRADTILPSNPQNYFSNLPKGCYNVCIDSGGLTMPMPSSPVFTHWQWLMSVPPYYNQVVAQGYNSQVADLHIYNSGNYVLLVNNGLCSDTAKEYALEISQPSICKPKEQGCKFDVHLDYLNWNCGCDTATIQYSISNQTKDPILFTTNGVLGLVGGVAAPKPSTNNYVANYSVATNGIGSFTTQFVFYYTIGNTVYTCAKDLVIDIDNTNCTSSCRTMWVAAKPNVANKTAESYLWVYPSVTSSTATVNYKYAASKIERGVMERQIILYSGVTGEQKRVFTAQEKGSVQIDVTTLPKGLYLVQLVQNGVIVQTEKLIVVR